MKIALAQINPLVGDIDGNCEKVLAALAEARRRGVHLVILPELAITGYPPKDLLLKPHFVERNRAAVERVAVASEGIVAVVGYAEPNETGEGKPLFNAAAICAGGTILKSHHKTLLPTYDVFDESRYFEPGTGASGTGEPGTSEPGTSESVLTIEVGGKLRRLGISICEDLWANEQFEHRRLYHENPIDKTVAAGAELLINISASPFSMGKPARRTGIFSQQAQTHHLPIAYVNQVGGNDALLFDGSSAFFAADGSLVAQGRAFEEDLLIVDTEELSAARVESALSDVAAIHRALVMGTRDYVRKCGFRDVVVGLSGGIDSAVTAVLAVEALGADHVHGVAMPSRFSSAHSLADAEALAVNLGIDYRVISIEELHAAAERALSPHFGDAPPGIAEENLQARARGQVLMALSNKFGWLLLTTGNKSELAVGYCTLYGDMCGGLAVISDVPKMVVYDLARHINEVAGRTLVPQNTIDKPPSAELRENQTDQDSLPAYETLDEILRRYVELEQSVVEIADAGFDRAVVEDIARKVDRNEYKRKQAATGLKVTSRAFGVGRRMPIAARCS